VRWPAAATDQDLDLAVVMTGVWETSDWTIGEPPIDYHVGDPAFDLLLATRLHEAIDGFERRGVAVVLVTTPRIGRGRQGTAHELRSIGPDHEARVARFNELVRQVAGEHPHVALVDYGAYVDAWPDELTDERLPDGIHPTEAAGAEMWDEFLGPELQRVVVELRAGHELSPGTATGDSDGAPGTTPVPATQVPAAVLTPG
jgi:hypothetical protein